MWLGPLHQPEFCAAVVESVEREKASYKTHARIKGMVSVARDVSRCFPSFRRERFAAD